MQKRKHKDKESPCSLWSSTLDGETESERTYQWNNYKLCYVLEALLDREVHLRKVTFKLRPWGWRRGSHGEWREVLWVEGTAQVKPHGRKSLPVEGQCGNQNIKEAKKNSVCLTVLCALAGRTYVKHQFHSLQQTLKCLLLLLPLLLWLLLLHYWRNWELQRKIHLPHSATAELELESWSLGLPESAFF